MDVLLVGSGPHPHLLLKGVEFLQNPMENSFLRCIREQVIFICLELSP